MTKRDLIVRISNTTGMIQQDVAAVVQHTLDVLAEALAQGQTIELRNFGVFEIKTRKARVGRNPTHPEHKIPIPARAVVKFTAGKDLREEVLKLSPAVPAPAAKPNTVTP